ncbi:MAG: agmatinase, partial [Sphingomonadaceae bacterium]|nr:agmatinase [Sphingomonadaceae bacterium]
MALPVIDLIGLPSDSNSSFERGPALAPNAIRRALWSDRGNLACEDGQE